MTGAVASRRPSSMLGGIGPGLAVAATGVGAGDLLAGSLLWLNSRRGLVGEHRNGPLSTVALVAALALFVATGVRELLDLAGGG